MLLIALLTATKITAMLLLCHPEDEQQKCEMQVFKNYFSLDFCLSTKVPRQCQDGRTSDRPAGGTSIGTRIIKHLRN